MELLDAFLAFALTLAALATVVTLVLEVCIRALGLKRKDQVQLVGRLVDHVVAKYLPQEKDRWSVVKGILENPFARVAMAGEEDAQRYFGFSAGAIYNEVSLEHILRRLLESAQDSVLKETQEALEERLKIVTNKYQEFASAVAADFKRRAQVWSLAVGVGLALVMNVDGVRLLSVYLQDETLRESIIEKLPPPPAGAQTTAGQDDDIDGYIDDLKTRLADIGELSLPLGGDYFPHCFLKSEAAETARPIDPLCGDDPDQHWAVSIFTWLLKVVATGLLIGLGAPFWYDVARRMAAVRTAFGGKPSREKRHGGQDIDSAASGAEKREALADLIKAVVADMKSLLAVEGQRPVT